MLLTLQQVQTTKDRSYLKCYLWSEKIEDNFVDVKIDFIMVSAVQYLYVHVMLRGKKTSTMHK